MEIKEKLMFNGGLDCLMMMMMMMIRDAL